MLAPDLSQNARRTNRNAKRKPQEVDSSHSTGRIVGNGEAIQKPSAPRSRARNGARGDRNAGRGHLQFLSSMRTSGPKYLPVGWREESRALPMCRLSKRKSKLRRIGTILFSSLHVLN